jgi:hypothetical protein
MPKGKGRSVYGTYTGSSTLHYEELDPTYYVRDNSFFSPGRVLSIILTESAGAQAKSKITDYTTSSSINEVRFKNNFVYTTVRRFVVVRQKREYCFACPIFTYSGRATTKHGVRAEEHGIIYTSGKTAQLLPGEVGIRKASLSVEMAKNVPPLDKASRIYYGIHHPIQYNVKVKEIGYIPKKQIPVLIGQWKEEDDKDTEQSQEVTRNASIPEVNEDEEEYEESDRSWGGTNQQVTGMSSGWHPSQTHPGYSQTHPGYSQNQIVNQEAVEEEEEEEDESGDDDNDVDGITDDMLRTGI